MKQELQRAPHCLFNAAAPLLSVKSLKEGGQRSSFIRWRGIGKAAASKSRDPVATDGVGEDVTLPELLLLLMK